MPEATPLIDYYALLNLPPRADLAGVENAYARLSDELVKRAEVDETSQAALERLNEAYSVLSRPELRRAYDQEFFAAEIAAAERARQAEERRRIWASRALVASLTIIILVQAGLLAWLGRHEAMSLFSAIAGLFS